MTTNKIDKILRCVFFENMYMNVTSQLEALKTNPMIRYLSDLETEPDFKMNYNAKINVGTRSGFEPIRN